MDTKKIKIKELQNILIKISPNFNADEELIEDLIETLKLPFDETIKSYQANINNLNTKIKHQETTIELFKEKFKLQEKLINNKHQSNHFENYNINCDCLYCKIITLKTKLENIAKDILNNDKKYKNYKNYKNLLEIDNLLKTCELDKELTSFKINTINNFYLEQSLDKNCTDYYELIKDIAEININTNVKLIKETNNRIDKIDLSEVSDKFVNDIKNYYSINFFSSIKEKILNKELNIQFINLFKTNIFSKDNAELLTLYRNRNKRLNKEIKDIKLLISKYIS